MKMNRIKKGKIIALAAVVIMGVSSCERDALSGKGKKVTVNFSLADVSYGEEETVTRSAGRERMEPETVMETVDGILKMYVTLEEEDAAPLRTLETIAPGTKIRIVAYDSSDNYADDNEYEVGAAGSLTSTTSASLEVPAGIYRFVAYSLNTNATLSYAATMGPYSPGSVDLLWGEAPNETIVEGGANDVTVPMYHQFSRVRLEATSTALGAYTISNIDAVLVGNRAGLTVKSGPTKGTAENQTFTRTTTLPSATVAFAQRMAYTGGDAVTSVLVTTATIGGTTHTNRMARFKRKLEPGKSYSLKIAFKNLEWARSNIYWNSSRLTFIPANGTTNYEGYQGVFFKFGSLVGVSPATVYSYQAGVGSIYSPNYFDQAVPIYVPSGYPSSPKWTATTSTSSGYSTWGFRTNNATDIPYLDPIDYAGSGSDFGRSSTYAIDAERNTTEMYQGLRGDICQYLSTATGVVAGNYRLPTSYEFGSASDWTTGGTAESNVRLGGNTGATNLLSADVPWAKSAAMGNVTLPAGGMRYSGTLNYVGADGYLWSGSAGHWPGASPVHAEDAYMLYLSGSGSGNHSVLTDRSIERSHGCPVRCVKN
jgi:hypothetical protein